MLVPVKDHPHSKSQTVSFIQVHEESFAPAKALAFLTQQAHRLHSPILSTLALKLETGEGKDHFVKVRSIIKDLIAKLEADAEAEASQKTFCDEKMGAAIEDRDTANGAIEGHTADLDAAKAEVAKLTDEIKDLALQVADLQKSLFEAKELRGKEKAANEKTLTDSKAGLEAIKNAIKVLKDFYEFVQIGFTPKGADRDGNTVADLAPKTQEGEYKGNQDAAKGILGLLDVIQSDFERTIETTEKEEEKAQKQFEDFEKDTKADIKDKKESKKGKEKDKESTEAEIIDLKQDLKDAQDDLKDAKGKLEKLKPFCVDTGTSWKERRAQMEAEVEALKEALAILSEI